MPLPAHPARPIEMLMIDNFDSFAWNLYQSPCILDAQVVVIRANAISPEDFSDLRVRSF
jgi:anthranilate synthase/indole-3-glycerol phosphate synthase/phosphoribosylanthranilate isomerase